MYDQLIQYQWSCPTRNDFWVMSCCFGYSVSFYSPFHSLYLEIDVVRIFAPLNSDLTEPDKTERIRGTNGRIARIN